MVIVQTDVSVIYAVLWKCFRQSEVLSARTAV